MWYQAAPFLAPMLGMLVFAGLLLLGVRLVRALGLVADPPPELQFEPPPPAAHSAADVAGREARVAERRQILDQCKAALTAHRIHGRLRAVLDVLPTIPAADWARTPAATPAQARELIERATAIAARADEEACAVRLQTDPAAVTTCSAARDAAIAAWSEVEALIKGLPDPGNRRLFWLLMALCGALIWCGVVFFLLER